VELLTTDNQSLIAKLNDKIAELEKATAATEALKNFYFKILNSISDPIFVKDRQHRLILVNNAECKLAGHTQDELLGKTDYDFFPKEQVDVFWEKDECVFETGEENINEEQINDTAGECRTIVTKKTLLTDARGNNFIVGIINDITKRKQAEEEIRKLSRAVKQSPSSVVITDLKGTIEYVNPKFTHVTGYSFEESIGRNPRILKSGEKSPEEYRDIWQTITSGKEWRGEFHNRKKNGELYWEYASISPIKNSDGVITHFVAVKEDITERKQIEEKITESMQQQQAILNNIPDMAWLKDSESRFIAVNEPFKQACGKKHDELIGKTDFDLWPHELAATYISDDKEVILSRKRKIVEEPLRDATGAERWIETIKIPIFGKEGEVIGTTGIARDVTGRKLAEEAMKQVNEKLRNAYAELQSAQSQVLQQEKMASIGQLAAGVAHEINNPMGFIISNLGSLQKYIMRVSEFVQIQAEAIDLLSEQHPDTESILNNLQHLKQSLKLDFILEDTNNLIAESLQGADRVKCIVQDLKNFSRIDETELKEADINAGLESTINIVWNELKYKTTLDKEYGDIPLIQCNPGQLNQVFMNILINAAQAIEKQGEIRVRSWYENGHVFISISDTGCGIPQDKVHRIFEPFFTTKEIGKGTGLGLSIAYDIIKKHHGELKVESTVGEGTTFIIKIPATGRDNHE
jgi:two-component system, NtrC family, sensor kinase